MMRVLTMALMALLIAVWAPVWAPAWSQEDEAEEVEVPEFGKPQLEMDPFNLSIIHRGRVQGKLSLTLILVIEKNATLEEIRFRLPQIRNDFNSALTVLARQRLNVNRPVDPDIIRDYLTPFAVQRLGPDQVSIFVKEALIRPG